MAGGSILSIPSSNISQERNGLGTTQVNGLMANPDSVDSSFKKRQNLGIYSHGRLHTTQGGRIYELISGAWSERQNNSQFSYINTGIHSMFDGSGNPVLKQIGRDVSTSTSHRVADFVPGTNTWSVSAARANPASIVFTGTLGDGFQSQKCLNQIFILGNNGGGTQVKVAIYNPETDSMSGFNADPGTWIVTGKQ